MSRIALVNMPFHQSRAPGIGVGVLKSALESEGFQTDVFHFNLSFAALCGPSLYDFLSIGSKGEMQGEYVYQPSLLVGEWLFAQHHFNQTEKDREEYLLEFLESPKAAIPSSMVAAVRGVCPLIPNFLERCATSTSWDSYVLIGFSCSFQQLIPSLSLAKLIKDRVPHSRIVFGGSQCEGEPGREALRAFPPVDYVLRGESDITLPRLARSVWSGQSISDIPGLVWRSGQGVIESGAPVPVQDLDSVPPPDYSEYYRQRGSLLPDLGPRVSLHIEGSRGCWWGQKHHCGFCSLPEWSIRYREKSAQRVIEELKLLIERCPSSYVPRIEFVDNILSQNHIRTLLPKLKASSLPFPVSFHTKASLTRSVVRALGDAGVNRVQPGIEHLNTRLLRLMNKGVTGLQNVHLLRLCAEYGILVQWNLLVGVPGEREEDYAGMLGLLRSMTHLDPPHSITRIRLMRFSPYFSKREELGLRNVRPPRAAEALYPFERDVVASLSRHFEHNCAESSELGHQVSDIQDFVRTWKQVPSKGVLEFRPSSSGGAVIRDRRWNWDRSDNELSTFERRLYLFCERPRTIKAIVAHLGTQAMSSPSLHGALDKFVSLGLMVSEGDCFLSVAVFVTSVAGSFRIDYSGLRNE